MQLYNFDIYLSMIKLTTRKVNWVAARMLLLYIFLITIITNLYSPKEPKELEFLTKRTVFYAIITLQKRDIKDSLTANQKGTDLS